MNHLLIISLLLTVSAEFAAEEEKTKENIKNTTENTLKKNNSWNVKIDNGKSINGYIYATIVKKNDNWEIDNFYEKKPDVTKSSKLELFATTPDLFYWTNVSSDMVKDCDHDNSKYYTVCSSSFADKKTGAAVLGVFFGGLKSSMENYFTVAIGLSQGE